MPDIHDVLELAVHEALRTLRDDEGAHERRVLQRLSTGSAVCLALVQDTFLYHTSFEMIAYSPSPISALDAFICLRLTTYDTIPR